MKTRRIFISLPADEWLTKQENRVKWAIVSAVEALGYTAEVFLDPRGTRSLSASLAWNATECERVMRRCEGCVVLGFPRWRINGQTEQIQLATDYNHYEGALAHTLGLPLLVLVQEGVLRRVVFDSSYKGYVGVIPENPSLKWLNNKGFTVPFGYFREKLAERRDIFLGYCSSSSATAAKIKTFLTGQLGLSVLDWATDFDLSTTILEQIELASIRCGAGIFLFTRDDALAGVGGKDAAVPRDNVVFEAGFFSAIKGKARILIVRESGAKMPADLGGDIYASLTDKRDIGPIKTGLKKFTDSL
jgi:hypothetical protein